MQCSYNQVFIYRHFIQRRLNPGVIVAPDRERKGRICEGTMMKGK